MKHFLYLAIAGCLLAFALLSLAHADSLGQAGRTKVAFVEDSASATVTLLPVATGQAYTIYGLIVNVNTADNVYLQCGSTQKLGRWYFAANGGIAEVLQPMKIQCPAGQAVNLVKGSATTPLSASVWYSLDN